MAKTKPRPKPAQNPGASSELDVEMKVTSKGGWVSLYAMGGALVVAIGWSIVGNIPTRVDGRGVFQRGELRDIRASGGGTLVDLDLSRGQEVAPGMVVGRIEQADVQAELRLARQSLQAAQDRLSLTSRSNQSIIDNNNRTIREINSRISRTEEQLGEARSDLQRAEERFARREITRAQRDAAQQRVDSLQRELDNDRNQVSRIRQENTRYEGEINNAQLEVDRAQLEVDQLTSGGEAGSSVTSMVAGRVVDVQKSIGDRIAEGDVIATVEEAGEELRAIALVPTGVGSRIEPGMRAQVVPANIQRERFGYVVGTVVFRNTFAIDRQTAVDRIGASAGSIVSSGAVYEVHVDLEEAETPTGFLWSSGIGPPDPIASGTEFDVSVIVAGRAPYTYVLPLDAAEAEVEAESPSEPSSEEN